MMGSSASATAPTVQPLARTLPREKPIVFSPREPLATPKTDTTQFALPEIKTKEHIRKKRKKQNLVKEETSSIGNAAADSETFSPVIRTRETVREQPKLHVSHSTEPEQSALPQIRTRQPQAASMRANTESVTPDTPQTLLPDIKSKQKYIALQKPTQVTPVQTNPQQAAQKMIQGDMKLCKPMYANETVPLPKGKNAAPAKPVRVQKQVRPAVVRKQKIKTASKAKIKSATPAAKALPSKASTAAPKQAVTAIRKGQALRDTAIKTAKVAKEAGKKVLRAIAAAAEKLVVAIGNYQPGGTPIGPVDISDIQGTLPDDLDPLRETIVLIAYQLLGKVTYFWGGKSLVLGWDSRWGTPTTVTAPGSGSTGKVLPFGLDCSGFVDWTFYNATNGAYLAGRGGGAASQHGYCTNIAWLDALPGDLVFYTDDSHVGIVCGYDSMGNLLVIHCSGGQNGVVVTGREGFAVAARPDLFTD